MKIAGFLLLALLVAGACSYFFDHKLLLGQAKAPAVHRQDSGGYAAVPPPAPSPTLASNPYAKGLVKCIGLKGHITFTDRSCPDGQQAQAVTLAATRILHADEVFVPPEPDQGTGSVPQKNKLASKPASPK